MRGLGLRWSPLLVLLAVSQFIGAARTGERPEVAGVPLAREAASPEERPDDGGSGETALPATHRHAPSPALRLLLHEASVRWHME